MVETNAVVMPIVSPVVPAPTVPTKKADSKAEANCNSRTIKEEPRIPIPVWPDPDGLSIHEPRVILRNVNNLRVGGFDHNCLSPLGYVFLRCAFYVPSIFRTLTHYLNGVHHVLLLVDEGITER